MSDFDQSVNRIFRRAKGIHLARMYQLMREPDFNRRKHLAQTVQLFELFDEYATQLRETTPTIDFDELDTLLTTAENDTDEGLSPVLARIEALVVHEPETNTRGLDDTDPFGVEPEEEEEEEEEEDNATLPPLVRELLGLLQTQSATISNHFEALLSNGANLSREEFLKRFNPLSFVTSCYQKKLREQTVSVTDAEFAEYNQLRDFATSAEAATFFEDLVNLHDFIADRIGVEHVALNE